MDCTVSCFGFICEYVLDWDGLLEGRQSGFEISFIFDNAIFLGFKGILDKMLDD